MRIENRPGDDYRVVYRWLDPEEDSTPEIMMVFGCRDEDEARKEADLSFSLSRSPYEIISIEKEDDDHV